MSLTNEKIENGSFSLQIKSFFCKTHFIINFEAISTPLSVKIDPIIASKISAYGFDASFVLARYESNFFFFNFY